MYIQVRTEYDNQKMVAFSLINAILKRTGWSEVPQVARAHSDPTIGPGVTHLEYNFSSASVGTQAEIALAISDFLNERNLPDEVVRVITHVFDYLFVGGQDD